MSSILIGPADIAVIIAGLSMVLWIGFRASKHTDSHEAYFMAGRRMPGWAVGFSLMATLISSSSFLALPEFSYRHDWRFIGTCFVFPIAMLMAWRWFMPFYRRQGYGSAYEYFEQRFGLWIRLYVALAFVLFAFLKMGIVLYGTSVALGTVTGLSVPLMIIIFGIVVVAYTVMGGLEAVIWTDVIQGSALLIGALVCVPVAIGQLPGGWSTLVTDAVANDKFSLAADQWRWTQFGLVIIVLGNFADYVRMVATDQMFVQRYMAVRSERDSRIMLLFAGTGSVLTWGLFTLLGTALWVFYRHVPDERIATLDALAVFPHFIITQLPAGVGGVVFLGLIMAAMSTLDSSINAIAQTITTDFYRRLLRPMAKPQQLVRIGQIVSLAFGCIMIAIAIYIHHTRSQALQELQNILTAIFGSGLAGLFLLGFCTRRARYLSVLSATALMLIGVVTWLVLDHGLIGITMPHPFWLAVFTNIFVFAAGYLLSLAHPRVSATSSIT